MGRIAAVGLVGALVVFVVIPVLAAMGVFQGNSPFSPVNRNNTANQIVQSGEAIGNVITEGINTGPGVPESSEPISTVDANLTLDTEGFAAGNYIPETSGSWDTTQHVGTIEGIDTYTVGIGDQLFTYIERTVKFGGLRMDYNPLDDTTTIRAWFSGCAPNPDMCTRALTVDEIKVQSFTYATTVPTSNLKVGIAFVYDEFSKFIQANNIEESFYSEYEMWLLGVGTSDDLTNAWAQMLRENVQSHD